MRKIVSTVIAASIAALMGGTAAWSFGPPFVTPPVQAANLLGHLNALIQDMQNYYGLVAIQTGPIASTATTGEQVLATTSLPGGTLSTPGQTLILRCAGGTASNGNNKTVHLYFGSYEYSTATMSTSGESWELEMTVSAVTATANSVAYGRGTTNTTVVAPTVTQDFVDNLSNSVTAKCTVTQGNASAADTTLYNFVVFQEK